MKEFKVRKNMTRDYLIEVLSKNQSTLLVTVDPKTTDLPARVETAIANRDDKKAITRNTVGNLCKEVCDALGDKFTEVPVPAPAPKAENAVKKSAKKAEPAPTIPTQAVLKATVFPDTIEVEGKTFNIDRSVKVIKDIRDDREYEFAFYWSPRDLRQFPYSWSESPRNPDPFPGDLDPAQLIFVGDNHPVVYCVSHITEGAYTVYERDFEEFEGIRYSNGVEFQIYSRPLDTDPATPDPGDTTT